MAIHCLQNYACTYICIFMFVSVTNHLNPIVTLNNYWLWNTQRNSSELTVCRNICTYLHYSIYVRIRNRPFQVRQIVKQIKANSMAYTVRDKSMETFRKFKNLIQFKNLLKKLAKYLCSLLIPTVMNICTYMYVF